MALVHEPRWNWSLMVMGVSEPRARTPTAAEATTRSPTAMTAASAGSLCFSRMGVRMEVRSVGGAGSAAGVGVGDAMENVLRKGRSASTSARVVVRLGHAVRTFVVDMEGSKVLGDFVVDVERTGAG